MKIYLVTAQGIYRHEIGAVYGSEERARAYAQLCADFDVDSYHEYHVIECELDSCARIEGYVMCSAISDDVGTVIAIYRKGKKVRVP
jgi:hypothetical protein